ncbi:MAG: hypothetical protein Q9225_002905 [Loekoesia sp. 1 TL-2023]
MRSPSKPRLITISPRTPSSKINSSQPATPLECRSALVSAFSPDTPPETPHVANRNEVDDNPTCPTMKEHRLGSLDTKICYPITPPDSRYPTPFGKTTSSACQGKHPCWVQPIMTQLDPSTAWIIQELEVLLVDFPMTALRLNSPVIERIRNETSSPPVPKQPARYRSSTAPHSRYSPWKPSTNQLVGLQSSIQGDHAPRSNRASRNTRADPTASTLQTIFPNARPHHLDSLHATYLALHYVKSTCSDFAAAPVSEVAASPRAASAKHSRSSSVVSEIPSKARAMLGLESPVPTSPSLPSPAKSWFRASTPELDPELKTRLENVQLLLETSIRKILVEIEGRSLVKQDDALVRAVGEVIRLGEQSSATQAS